MSNINNRLITDLKNKAPGTELQVRLFSITSNEFALFHLKKQHDGEFILYSFGLNVWYHLSNDTLLTDLLSTVATMDGSIVIDKMYYE